MEVDKDLIPVSILKFTGRIRFQISAYLLARIELVINYVEKRNYMGLKGVSWSSEMDDLLEPLISESGAHHPNR